MSVEALRPWAKNDVDLTEKPVFLYRRLIAAKQLKLDLWRCGIWPWTEALTEDLDELETTLALPPVDAAVAETMAAETKRTINRTAHVSLDILARTRCRRDIGGNVYTATPCQLMDSASVANMNYDKDFTVWSNPGLQKLYWKRYKLTDINWCYFVLL